jgi:hypothetical protein
MTRHQRHDSIPDAMVGLDQAQVDAVTTMPNTRIPACRHESTAAASMRVLPAPAGPITVTTGRVVLGVGPSATPAQLADGAGTAADTLHKLVYEHRTCRFWSGWGGGAAEHSGRVSQAA